LTYDNLNDIAEAARRHAQRAALAAVAVEEAQAAVLRAEDAMHEGGDQDEAERLLADAQEALRVAGLLFREEYGRTFNEGEVE
jgi:hypothetical protein